MNNKSIAWRSYSSGGKMESLRAGQKDCYLWREIAQKSSQKTHSNRNQERVKWEELVSLYFSEDSQTKTTTGLESLTAGAPTMGLHGRARQSTHRLSSDQTDVLWHIHVILCEHTHTHIYKHKHTSIHTLNKQTNKYNKILFINLNQMWGFMW